MWTPLVVALHLTTRYHSQKPTKTTQSTHTQPTITHRHRTLLACAGHLRHHQQQQQQTPDDDLALQLSDLDLGADAALDALIASQIDAAFANLSADDLTDDELANLELIDEQAKTVLDAVLSQLDSDQADLREQLNAKVAAEARARSEDLLRKLDTESAAARAQIAEAQQTIRGEMQTLKSLNDEYKRLKSEPAALDRSSIAGAVAFLLGLACVSAALSETAKLASGTSISSTVPSLALDLVLAAAGLGTYFSRQGESERSD